jgi:hypothetical protein
MIGLAIRIDSGAPLLTGPELTIRLAFLKNAAR